MTALDGHTPPDSRNADPGAHEPKDAAGPLTGELPTETVADADISPDASQAAAAAAIATAIVAVVPVTAPVVVATAAAPPATATDSAGSTTPVVVAPGAAQASPPQPLPGLVPARVDANGAVVPVITTATGTTPGADGQGTVPTATTAGSQATTATAQGTTPAPAATITLTLTSKDAGQPPATPAPATPATAQGATTAPGATPATVAAPTISPSVTPQAGSGQDAPPAAASREPAPAPAAAASPTAAPSPAFGQAAPAPIQSPAPGGIAHGAGGLTTPHELAHELGTRVHMAVREGGRELLVNLRPRDLGQLTIRVTMTDGVLHAQITADRPEAARMLQQSLGQLDTALSDLGYSLDGLDVSYGGQDARDARSSSAGTEAPPRTDAIDDSEAVTTTAPTTHAAASPSRLDLLA